jgi:hypothetical protein
LHHRQALRAAPLLAALLALGAYIPAHAHIPRMNHSHAYEVVDVQSVRPHNAESAVRSGTFSKPDYVVDCHLLIVGGGTGGVAAALRAVAPQDNQARKIKVCMVEETDWIGGQMTAQGVSALDENYLVEGSGACRSYQYFRQAIRNHYKTKYQVSEEAAANPLFDPGSCWVSRLAFEPKVAVEKLQEMLQPAIDDGSLAVYTRHKMIYARLKSGEIVCAKGDKPRRSSSHEILGVGMLDLSSGRIIEFRPQFCLDATELGDLLPLAGLDYTIGSDSQRITGEAHAPEVADPENVQDFTYPFVVEFCPQESHIIEKPPRFDEYNAKGKFSFQGYKMFESVSLSGPQGAEAAGKNWFLPFWEYRRLLAQKNFCDPAISRDIAMINWDSNDVRGENIVDKQATNEARRLQLGQLISLGFLYWLQTEAPRDDGGKGYPELKLRADILDTVDGVAKFPYIRESRRVYARKTIVESDITAATNPGARAKPFPDSIGIGLYPVDIHGMQEVPGAGQETKPFQIPLSALIPAQQTNVFPACKNIGTTHITNGAYRLHPIEWAIGEAQGALCSLLVNKTLSVHNLFDVTSLLSLQRVLVEHGAPLYWYDDVPTTHPHFASIQFLAVSGIMKGNQVDLNFRPDDILTKQEAASALTKVLPGAGEVGDNAASAESWCVMKGVLTEPGEAANSPITLDDIRAIRHHLHAKQENSSNSRLNRGEFAEILYHTATRHLDAVR